MKNQILVAFTLAGALACAPPTTEVQEIDVSGIRNFSRMDGPAAFAGSRVGFGGVTQATAMPWLKNEGFATVINLRLDTEEGADIDGSRAAAEAAGLNYIHLPFDTSNPDPNLVDDFLSATRNEANQPVYIHCGSATRVAALWMIGRVLEDGWEIEAAGEEAEVIAGRPEVSIAFATKYLASQKE